ncbi:hypothetical protein BBP40_005498 [Aspergillus hancockii]|nr:hypothetical protein BBP40_005498 [Aspergillus hancockii]
MSISYVSHSTVSLANNIDRPTNAVPTQTLLTEASRKIAEPIKPTSTQNKPPDALCSSSSEAYFANHFLYKTVCSISMNDTISELLNDNVPSNYPGTIFQVYYAFLLHRAGLNRIYGQRERWPEGPRQLIAEIKLRDKMQKSGELRRGLGVVSSFRQKCRPFNRRMLFLYPEIRSWDYGPTGEGPLEIPIPLA